MNAATYSRSWRRSRNVKMSDCQSWFGAARSKRRGGCSRAAIGTYSGISPASCRIFRTVVSLTPSPSKRASASRILRLPQSGCVSRAATTAVRSVGCPVACLRARPCGFGTRPASPSAM